MEIGLNILLLLTLFIAFWQDKQSRSISILVFAFMAIASVGLFVMTDFSWMQVVFNTSFVLLVIGFLFIYVSLKEGSLTNIFKAHFGLGDLVFFLAITPLFGNRNFILFFITGMILSAMLHLIVTRGKRNETIPLAGYLSIYVVGLKTAEWFLDNEFFYTDIF